MNEELAKFQEMAKAYLAKKERTNSVGRSCMNPCAMFPMALWQWSTPLSSSLWTKPSPIPMLSGSRTTLRSLLATSVHYFSKAVIFRLKSLVV